MIGLTLGNILALRRQRLTIGEIADIIYDQQPNKRHLHLTAVVARVERILRDQPRHVRFVVRDTVERSDSSPLLLGRNGRRRAE